MRSILLLTLAVASACPERDQHAAGDARCDAAGNTESCAWDGGDCCAMTCRGALCGERGYDCRDPAHADTAAEARAEADCDGGRSRGGNAMVGAAVVGAGFVLFVAALATWRRIQCSRRSGAASEPKPVAFEARFDELELTTVVSAAGGGVVGLPQELEEGSARDGARGAMAWTEDDARSRSARRGARAGPRSPPAPLPVARPSTPVVEATRGAPARELPLPVAAVARALSDRESIPLGAAVEATSPAESP